MDAFRASPTDGQVTAYTKAVSKFDTKALAMAVDRFRRGEVPWFTSTYPPVAPELAREVSLHHRNLHREDNVLALKPPEHGHISVDHGFGRINLIGLSRREVEVVDELKGRSPDGRNLAGMSADEIRKAITQPMLPGVVPRLKGMS